MSSLPGNNLEDFLAWQYDFIVEDNTGTNVSLAMVEALGQPSRRVRITKEQFAPMLVLAEPYRAAVEDMLLDFNEDTQSWRMYAESVDMLIPEEVQERIQNLANAIRGLPPRPSRLPIPNLSMAISQTELIKLFVAYFGRPPFLSALQYYMNQNTNTQSVADSFSEKPESKELYSKGFLSNQINTFYHNLFNRDAEPAALLYWEQEVRSGRLSPGMAAYAIMVGAQGPDKEILNLKLAATNHWMQQVAHHPNHKAFQSAYASKIAREFLAKVVDQDSCIEALEQTDHYIERLLNPQPAQETKALPAEPKFPNWANSPEVEIDYTNYKGVRGVRRIIPIGAPHFGTSDYHPEPQYLLEAWDVEKKNLRTFAMTDIHRWGRPTLMRVGDVNFQKVEPLKISAIDLMEATARVSGVEGHLNGTSNWGAAMIAALKEASRRNDR